MTDRVAGGLAIAAGTVLAFAAQAMAPVGAPLYDGVVVQEPYRYLHPIGQQPGNPTSFTATPAVTGDVSPEFVAATTESPAQAQLFGQRDAFQLPPGATSLTVSITPVEPPSVEPEFPIAGNVYRFAVTDQDGVPLAIKPCQNCLTLFLRGPEFLDVGRLERFTGSGWEDVGAIHNPMTGMYQWNATALGDFAILNLAPEPGLGVSGILLLGGAAALVVLLLATVWLFRLRPPSSRPPARPDVRGVSPGPRSRGIPSKRKRPRTPPTSGRSDR